MRRMNRALVLTVFIEFLKNFNKEQFVNRRLTKSLEQYGAPHERCLTYSFNQREFMDSRKKLHDSIVVKIKKCVLSL